MEDLSGAFVENNALFVIPQIQYSLDYRFDSALTNIYTNVRTIDYSYWLLTLLTLFQRLTVFLYTIKEYSVRIIYGVYRGVTDEEYAFHQGSNTAFSLYKLKTDSAASASVEWIYNPERKHFKHVDSSLTDEYVYFPYLSAQIYHGNLRLYDISEFVSQLKWRGSSQRPSPKHILSAWSLQTGVVLDANLSLSLHTITEEGEEENILLEDI
jgi:hypothetical protein